MIIKEAEMSGSASFRDGNKYDNQRSRNAQLSPLPGEGAGGGDNLLNDNRKGGSILNAAA
ncbi:MAG: hypothetical protein IJL67_13225 [Oscillospiraceae bacterium]|nr:hypothetical protein [Oscillospiraceae bacterium]